MIVQIYPMLPADGEEGRIAAAPIGRDGDLYHQVLHEWTDLVRLADDLGFWGISTIEHHLHSEGYEVGPNPGVLNAYWAAIVKNARVGALGYVMATQDPIRVAEETAILDHLTKGKFFVGLARGYQSRWTNILGQHSGAVATLGDKSEEDHRNRRVFEEKVDMLLRCWTEESVEFRGETYEAPFPYDTGVENYPAAEIAKHAGAPGEIDADGAVRRVSVVPKPYTDPHPPLFIATSKSPETITYAAKKGFIPTYFMPTAAIADHAQLYVESAAEAGITRQYGERQNLVRWPHITSTAAGYDDRLREYDLDIYKNFYGPFFPQFPNEPDTDHVASMKESDIFIGGTVEQSIDAWQRTLEQIPAEYITLIWHYAQVPKEVVAEEMSLFMEEILPHLDVPDFDAANEDSSGA
ncbi:MAG: alkanesulfonate monooxygenase SsuD [Verrucomicrobiales bacterium]|jgi:alkanesulfonate monooxygenase SsuD/methylene tetrahydromethanopterin reductase-like flavin-dependent oxidoreductase (luciferase family)